jgi:hypothetical protein
LPYLSKTIMLLDLRAPLSANLLCHEVSDYYG